MSSIIEFANTELFPALFEVLDQALPEFQFRKNAGGHWVSGSKLRVDGSEGNRTGKVYVYSNSPYFLKDQVTGGKAITTYIQDSGKASSWPEAIRYLASYAGLTVPSRELTEADIEKLKESELKARIFEAANDFFIDNLSNDKNATALSPEAEDIRKYLFGRRYTRLLRRHWDELELQANKMELGFIPSQDALREHLKARDFTEVDSQRLVLGNLITAIGKSHTLSIPFRDPIGRIQGFAFRSITWTKEDKVGKYLYSTGLQRNSFLFNLKAVKGDKDLVVVEGLLDALCAKALGLENVVALGGTSLNAAQIKAMRRSGAESITLCLDQDQAGQVATDKAIDEILKSGEDIKVYVATLPPGFKDPDELIRDKGLDAFKEVISKAKTHYLYRLGKYFDEAEKLKREHGELDDKDRDILLEEVVKFGAQAEGPIEKDLFRKEFLRLKEQLGLEVGEDALEAAVEHLNYSHEKEKQTQELWKIHAEFQDLLTKGKPEAAKELLDKQSKQVNIGLLEKSYHALTKPITEDEIREALKRKPDQIDSGFKFKGEPLYLPSGAITILAAPTSHGKTSFQINLALNVAGDPKNKPVHFFSYEEDRAAIVLKALNTYAGITLSKNNRRSIGDYIKTGSEEFIAREYLNDVSAFKNSKDSFFNELIATERLNIHYAEYSAEELVGAIRYLHKQEKVGAVFIDYMQLLRLKDDQKNSRQEEVKQICLILKDCAVDTGLPIILGAQFNRTVTTIVDMHSTAIGEAGDIERIANLIIGFWNKQFPELGSESQKTAEIYATILKSRDTSVGDSETFDFNGNTGRISNKALAKRIF